MKHLKTYKIFEAVIKPLDVSELIEELIELNPRTIEQANQLSNRYNIDIVTYNQFMESIDDEMRAGAPSRDQFMFGPPPGMRPPPGFPPPPPSGMHFALMNKHTGKMNLVVDYNPFMMFLTRMAPPQLQAVIKSILGHESIHYQQFAKMGNDPDKYVVDSPVTNKKGYLGHHTEVMAHAFSIIDELKSVENKSKEEILQIIQSGGKGGRRDQGHRILDDYYNTFGSGDRTIKKLNKYLYQYVEELFGEE
tara:strand:+ start:74264 stop:75010 length:747 start_codon:yes stop_codon:yes gene_type:complete